MKQKHRKWAGVLLAGAMMLLSATGSGYAAENNGHSPYARYLSSQKNAAFIVAAPAQVPATFGDSTASSPAQVPATFGDSTASSPAQVPAAFRDSTASAPAQTSAVSSASQNPDPSNHTGQDFVPLLGQISLSSDFHNMLHQWSEHTQRPLKEMVSLLSDSQQSAAETLLRNLNTTKTSEDKSSSTRMVQYR